MPARRGVTPRRFLRIRLGRMCGLTGHECRKFNLNSRSRADLRVGVRLPSKVSDEPAIRGN